MNAEKPRRIAFEGAVYASPDELPAEARARYDAALAAKARRRTAWIMGVAFLLLTLMVLGGMVYIVWNGGQVDRFGRIR